MTMAIPRLNAYDLLPPGVHEASMAEVEQRFGVGPKRTYLIEQGLKPVAQELVQMGVSELYLGGSFTTDKASPGDQRQATARRIEGSEAQIQRVRSTGPRGPTSLPRRTGTASPNFGSKFGSMMN